MNPKWHGYMPFAQFLYPLFFAVFLKVFSWRRRFIEHLVFSMHYQALALLVVIITWPLYRMTGVALTQMSAILAIAVTLVMILYLIFAVRPLFRQSWPLSVVKGLLLYFDYYLIYMATTYSMLVLAIFAVMRDG